MVTGTLADLAERVAKEGVPAPAVILVGDVVARAVAAPSVPPLEALVTRRFAP